MTYVKTLKTNTRYRVHGVSVADSGASVLLVRQPSGKGRKLTVRDVGRARFEAAAAHYFKESRAAQ